MSWCGQVKFLHFIVKGSHPHISTDVHSVIRQITDFADSVEHVFISSSVLSWQQDNKADKF